MSRYKRMPRSVCIRQKGSGEAEKKRFREAGSTVKRWVTKGLPGSGAYDDCLMLLLDDSPALIWRSGPDAGCNYFNRAWLEFTGRSMEASLGDGWADDVHPDDVEACVSKYLDAFNARRSFLLEYRLRRYDGAYRWIIDAGNMLRSPDGQFTGYIGICLDITERKIAENTLSAFFSASPVGNAIFDDKFRYLRINETLASINGIPEEDHYGKAVSEIVPDVSPFIEDMYRWILDTGESIRNVELCGETQKHPGVLRHWLSSHFPILGCDGKPAYIGASVLEITDRKNVEREMIVYQEQLRSLAEAVFLAEERERRRIAGELHDQIGQTLALAKIRLKTMADELAGRAAGDMLQSIVSLIDYSIREIRTLTFKISPPQLFEVGLEAALRCLCEKFSAEHGVEFSVVAPAESCTLHEERRIMLFGVVRELLVNIVKHAGAAKAVVTLLYDDNSVAVHVEDDGKGFDFEKISLIRRKGRGFGLFNVRQKVEYAGGIFHLDSAPGLGTKISIRVPLGG